MKRAEIFYRIIERNVHALVSCTVDKSDLIKVVLETVKAHPELDADKLGIHFSRHLMAY